MKTVDDIALRVRDEFNNRRVGYISYYLIAEVIKMVFFVISEELDSGEDVSIPNFGKFKRKLRAARTGRDMTTGLSVPIPERYMPVFEPSKHLKEKISGVTRK